MPSKASAPAARPTRPASKAATCIIEIGGRKITGLDDFDLALRRFSAGDTIDVTATRAGKEVKLKVTLGVPR